jgi:hypothetical protein
MKHVFFDWLKIEGIEEPVLAVSRGLWHVRLKMLWAVRFIPLFMFVFANRSIIEQ